VIFLLPVNFTLLVLEWLISFFRRVWCFCDDRQLLDLLCFLHLFVGVRNMPILVIGVYSPITRITQSHVYCGSFSTASCLLAGACSKFLFWRIFISAYSTFAKRVGAHVRIAVFIQQLALHYILWLFNVWIIALCTVAEWHQPIEQYTDGGT